MLEKLECKSSFEEGDLYWPLAPPAPLKEEEEEEEAPQCLDPLFLCRPGCFCDPTFTLIPTVAFAGIGIDG